MVRGSGSHSRQQQRQSNTSRVSSSNNNRSSRETTSNSRNRRTAAAVPEAVQPPRSNRGGGNRRVGASSQTSAAAATTSSRDNNNTVSTRLNHGSGTRNSSITRDRQQRSNNYGGGTNGASATTTRESSTTTREGQRVNHGSGIRNSLSNTTIARESTTTTRERQRVNHGSGTHRENRDLNSIRHSRFRRSPQTTYSERSDHHEPNVCGCLFQCLGIILMVFYGTILWVLCCCRKTTTTTTNDAATNNSSSISNNNNNNRNRNWGGSPPRAPYWLLMPIGLILSGLVFSIMIRNSMMENNFVTIDSKNVLTLFSGQTQRIYLPFFIREVSVTVVNDPPGSRGVRAAVFKSRKCPPLNGPRVELKHDSKLDLQASGFVFDYYNFNYGSSVDVWFDQLSGGTYFYLLKGAQALEEIQTGANTDPDYWERIAVTKRHVKVGSSSLHYQIVGKRDDGDNIYTLVYDNESSSFVSSVDVRTDIVLTTHDLSGYRPICDHMRQYDSCRVSASQQDCILIEAFQINEEDEEKKSQLLLDETTDIGTVSLQIDTYRNWKSIALYSTIPLLVSVFIYSFLFLWRKIRERNENDDDRSLTESLLPPESLEVEDNNNNRPPPTAPEHVPETVVAAALPSMSQPSAPVEDGVVMVPPESVEVVTK